MLKILKKHEPLFFSPLLIIFIALSLLHILTGYADNGDFLRSAGFLFEKPHGFSTMWPAETEEWKRRFFSEWHDKWVFLPNWPTTKNIFSYSSYKLYLLLQVKLSALITNNASEYSIISGSILSRLIIFLTFASLAHSIRRQLSTFPAWLFVITSGILFIDTNWIAFLNSFYEEQIAIIFLPVLGLLLLKFYKNHTIKIGVVVLLCATIIGSSKTAYFYLPLLVSIFMLPFFAAKKEIIKLLFVALACQAISSTPVYFGKYEKANSYHAVYFGALKVLTKNEAASIQSIGAKPVLHECIGVPVFGSLGRKCMETADASYGDVLRLIVSRPSIATRMIFNVFNEGEKISLNYLGRSIKNAPNFSDEPIFNLWPKVFAKGFNFITLLLLVASVVFLMAKTTIFNKEEKAILLIGIFFSIFGFSQYIISLGDGFYEIKKHLAAGNYALALSLPFTSAVFIAIIIRLIKPSAALYKA